MPVSQSLCSRDGETEECDRVADKGGKECSLGSLVPLETGESDNGDDGDQDPRRKSYPQAAHLSVGVPGSCANQPGNPPSARHRTTIAPEASLEGAGQNSGQSSIESYAE